MVLTPESGPEQGQTFTVGSFFILGGELELPWAYERMYKMDITDTVSNLDPQGGTHVHYKFQLAVTKYDGTVLEANFPAPVIVKRASNADHDELILPLWKVNDLPSKVCVCVGGVSGGCVCVGVGGMCVCVCVC